MGFGKKNREKIEEGTPTLIGKNTSFEGNFSGNESICIDGSFKGYIDCRENVFINREAVVEGDIVGKNIVIHGQVRGNIRAREEIVIGEKGRVIGDICTKIFTVERGGVLHGKCHMEKSEEEKSPSGILEKFSLFGGGKQKSIKDKLEMLDKEMDLEPMGDTSSQEDDDVIEVVSSEEDKNVN